MSTGTEEALPALVRHEGLVDRVLEQITTREITQEERQALIICLANELGTKRPLTHEFDKGGLFSVTLLVLRDIDDADLVKLILTAILETVTEHFISHLRTDLEQKLDMAA